MTETGVLPVNENANQARPKATKGSSNATLTGLSP